MLHCNCIVIHKSNLNGKRALYISPKVTKTCTNIKPNKLNDNMIDAAKLDAS